MSTGCHDCGIGWYVGPGSCR